MLAHLLHARLVGVGERRRLLVALAQGFEGFPLHGRLVEQIAPRVLTVLEQVDGGDDECEGRYAGRHVRGVTLVVVAVAARTGALLAGVAEGEGAPIIRLHVPLEGRAHVALEGIDVVFDGVEIAQCAQFLIRARGVAGNAFDGAHERVALPLRHLGDLNEGKEEEREGGRVGVHRRDLADGHQQALCGREDQRRGEVGDRRGEVQSGEREEGGFGGSC